MADREPRDKVKVLFVCLGNICRSPLAEGALRHLAEQRGLGGRVEVESCGTGGYHVGEGAFPKSVEVARRAGIDLSRHRARQLQRTDFDRFDFVLAMDEQNLRDMRRIQQAGQRAETGLLLDHTPRCGVRDVPDPYWSGNDAFQQVLDLVRNACAALLDRLQAEGRL